MNNESNQRTINQQIIKNKISILVFIFTAILLSLFYHLSIITGSKKTKDFEALQKVFQITKKLLNDTIGATTVKTKQIQAITILLNELQDNINKINQNDHDELTINTLKKKIEDTENKTETLKPKYNVIEKEYNQLKKRVEKARGDQFQLEEQNQVFKNQKYQNNILKEVITKYRVSSSLEMNTDLFLIFKSNIIESLSELKLLSEWIDKDKGVQLRLIYSGRNGDSFSDFHLKVDKYFPTVVIIHDTENQKYGGYTEQSWAYNDVDNSGRSEYKEDKFSFLFSLSKKKKYLINNSSKAILVGKDFLCAFGSGPDLYIVEKCVSSNGYNNANFPETYGDKTEEKNEVTNFNDYFDVKEIEVFHVFKS